MAIRELNKDTRYLKGVGPQRSDLLKRMGIDTIEKLLWLFPRRYEDRSQEWVKSEEPPKDPVLITGDVQGVKTMRLRSGRLMTRAVLKSQSSSIELIWFNMKFLQRSLEDGKRLAVYGQLIKKKNKWEMTHPEFEVLNSKSEARIHTGRIVPIYPLTKDLTQRTLRMIQYQSLLDVLRVIEDPVPDIIRQENQLINRKRALKEIHFPSTLDHMAKAYSRLVWDEFFLLELAMGLARKKKIVARSNKSFNGSFASDFASFKKMIGYELSPSQLEVIKDVESDFTSAESTQRLLQGDVGSGKTTIAAYKIFKSLKHGFQSAFLAPTEVLARQHYLTLVKLFGVHGFRIELLVQGVSHDKKSDILARARKGESMAIVGTHSIFSHKTSLPMLKDIIIDEQHRFGVDQRKRLEDKSKNAKLLIMSATPIPRTMMMGLGGHAKISELAPLPNRKQSVKTAWLQESDHDSAANLAIKTASEGGLVFIVCPTVRVSKQSILRSVESTYKEIQDKNPDCFIGCLHSKIEQDAKESILKKFSRSKGGILVASTIIEVGIDIPAANMIIIENADRYGLAQLHQLRGRVGRKGQESHCLLVSSTNEAKAVERLNLFCETASGDQIAKIDLMLRGPGDMLGVKQHGVPPIRIGNLSEDKDIAQSATQSANKLLQQFTKSNLSRQYPLLFAEIDRRFSLKQFAGQI